MDKHAQPRFITIEHHTRLLLFLVITAGIEDFVRRALEETEEPHFGIFVTIKFQLLMHILSTSSSISHTAAWRDSRFDVLRRK